MFDLHRVGHEALLGAWDESGLQGAFDNCGHGNSVLWF